VPRGAAQPLKARRAADAVLALAAYTVLTVAVLRPLAADPAQMGFPNPDTYGNTWAMAWVVHQARADPLRLYDANIYYPHEKSFAFTESLLPEALQAAPILLAGGSPLLAHNLVLLVSFPLCGLGAYLLARILAVLGLDILAAIGWAWISLRLRRPHPMATAVALATAVELWPSGLAGSIRDVPPPPATARWLADAPRGPVLELPWSEGENALYVYWFTAHWQPMANGWGAFEPRDDFGLVGLGGRWPTEYTAGVFRKAGIRYVVVHTDRVSPGQRRRMAEDPLPYAVRVGGGPRP
jgi:hypothetical protein